MGEREAAGPLAILLYGKQGDEEGGRGVMGMNSDWGVRGKHMHQHNRVSLMISLLACTQTYKNITALISSTPHTITVLQTLKTKIQTKPNQKKKEEKKS